MQRGRSIISSGGPKFSETADSNLLVLLTSYHKRALSSIQWQRRLRLVLVGHLTTLDHRASPRIDLGSRPTTRNMEHLFPSSLPSSPLHPSYKPPSRDSDRLSLLASFLAVFEAAPKVEIPQCVGVFDPITRSVWVTDTKDMEILFNRGFFGKGTLSRSEPTWASEETGPGSRRSMSVAAALYAFAVTLTMCSCRCREDSREETAGTQAVQD